MKITVDELPDHLRRPDPSIYKRGSYVVVDFETTGLLKGHPLELKNHVVMASWYDSTTGEIRSVFGTEYEQGELLAAVNRADFIVAHNAKFELGWLSRCGLDKPVLVYDTMLADYVLGGNQWRYASLSLEACAERRGWTGKGRLVSLLIKGGVCPSEIPRSLLKSYCERDVELCRDLFTSTVNQLTPRLLATVYTRCLTSYVLAQIEMEGLALDEAAVRERTREMEIHHAKLEAELTNMTGGINLASPKQLGEYLYDTLGFAVPSRRGEKEAKRRTDEETISSLSPKTAEQRRFIELFKEHRGGHSVLTKYLRKFTECCDTAGGVIFAVFNQTNTATHRLSSSGLEYKTQFQNLQRDLKPLFKAKRDGYLIGEVDGAQLEFRVAAHLGRDDRAIEDIAAGVDVHSATARILGIDRQSAKSETFKPLYGGRRGTPAQERYYEYFRNTYTGITAAQQRWINEVLETGKLETTCLDFYWPDTRMERSGYVTNTTAICNYPVQSLATADIIPIALVYLWHMLRANGMRTTIVNTVHDSVVAEVHPDEVEDFTNLSRRCFINVVYWYLQKMYGEKFLAPLGVGVAYGHRWGDKVAKASEQKFNAEEELWKQSADV